MSFSQALSGLNAASNNLKVMGNNIANSQTVGFKSSSMQFADVYANSKVGLGTRVSAVLQSFTAGNLESTNRSMDLAISGDGFLRFNQSGQVVYSRNGQLNLTPEGYLVNGQGARLMGENGILQVPAEGMTSSATTQVEGSFNLDARTAVPAARPAFSPTDASSYDYANTATVFDSLGNPHTMTTYFIKTAEAATGSTWTVRAAVDGTLSPQTQAASFNTSGVLAGYAASAFTYSPGRGAADMSITLDLTGTTQFGNESSVATLNQNGYTAGSLVGFTIDKSGSIIGNYSNEQKQTIGVIQLASFRNPEGLMPVGNNAWAETTASGQPLVGQAGTGQYGSIESGVVETSNVDLTRELVNLIIAQRTFQANAQTIKTQDEVLQQAVNLR